MEDNETKADDPATDNKRRARQVFMINKQSDTIKCSLLDCVRVALVVTRRRLLLSKSAWSWWRENVRARSRKRCFESSYET